MKLEYRLRLGVPDQDIPLAESMGALRHAPQNVYRFMFVPVGLDIIAFSPWWIDEVKAAFFSGQMGATAEDMARANAVLAGGVQPQGGVQPAPVQQVPPAPQAPQVPQQAPPVQQAPQAPAPQQAAEINKVQAQQTGENPESTQKKGQGLASYLKDIKKTIEGAFPVNTWVAADVVSISNGNHKYLELVEYDDAGKELAKSKGMIWSRKASILDRFASMTGMRLDKGMKVLVSVKPSMHEKFGLSLVIEDIDPSYTLGDMEAKVQRIRDGLKSRGLASQRNRVPLPYKLERIAVVAPEAAAGLGDFNSKVSQLDAAGLTQIDYFHATFQGHTSSKSIQAAYQSIVEAQAKNGFVYDAIVMIRGGGDKAGLLELNDLEIASSICMSTVPVLVGIGHDRDTTILDELAAMSFSTPSMVGTNIVDHWVSMAHAVKTTNFEIQKTANGIVRIAQDQVTAVSHNIKLIVDSELGRASSAIQYQEQSIRELEKAIFEKVKQDLRNCELDIMGVSPSRILQQGYGYLISGPGKTIPTREGLRKEKTATLRLRDGDIEITPTTTGETP